VTVVVDGCGGCAGSADAGRMTRTGRDDSWGARACCSARGSTAVLAIIKPPPKPIARLANVVPTPTKKAPVVVAIVASPPIEN
jgi:hypothetical protein